MRKATDDVMARAAAERVMGDLVKDASSGEVGNSLGADLVSAFKAVEFETTSKVVQGEEIRLRRLVLTGPWEVDPSGK